MWGGWWTYDISGPAWSSLWVSCRRHGSQRVQWLGVIGGLARMRGRDRDVAGDGAEGEANPLLPVR